MRTRGRITVLAATAAIASVVGTVSVALAAPIAGGGSTFMANMMDICGAQYNRSSNSNPNGDTISYAATGSGTGRQNFANNTYKFGGTDSAYPSGAPANFVYVPLVAGPIAIGYKLDGVSPAGQALHLSAQTVAKIFAGQVKMWNDPAIQSDNTAKVVPAVRKVTKTGVTVTGSTKKSKVTLKGVLSAAAMKRYANKLITITSTTTAGASKVVYRKKASARFSLTTAHSKNTTYAVKVHLTSLGSISPDDTVSGVTLNLPGTPIKVAYRSGNSGTTNNFTRYLNAVAPAVWSKPANDDFGKAFPGTLPADGTFQGANGNDGVANYVKTTNGAITYAELSFVEERASSGVKAAEIANNAGVYVAPSSSATAEFYAEAAVAADGQVTADYTVQSASAYLINAIAYGLAYTVNTPDNVAVKSYFSYFLGTCSPKSAAGAGYAALTGSILTKALAQVDKIAAG